MGQIGDIALIKRIVFKIMCDIIKTMLMQDRIKATVNCGNGPYTISLSAKDNKFRVILSEMKALVSL